MALGFGRQGLITVFAVLLLALVTLFTNYTHVDLLVADNHSRKRTTGSTSSAASSVQSCPAPASDFPARSACVESSYDEIATLLDQVDDVPDQCLIPISLAGLQAAGDQRKLRSHLYHPFSGLCPLQTCCLGKLFPMALLHLTKEIFAAQFHRHLSSERGIHRFAQQVVERRECWRPFVIEQ